MSTLPQVELPATGSKADPSAQLEGLLQGAGVFRLDDLGWIEVRGGDRVRWLNGMVTNSIQALAPGEGCFNFILNAQGRIQGTVMAFAEAERILLETERSQIAGLVATLDRFIIMDDVELAEVPTGRRGIGVAGPLAGGLLRQLGFDLMQQQPPCFEEVSWRGAKVILVAAHSPLVPRFELWSEGAVAESFVEALSSAGAVLGGAEAVEWLRLLEGTPRYGMDIRARDLPQETNQTRALHFAKGCYLGQEIVERIRSRGNVHRSFGGFLLDGPLPEAGSPIDGEGKVVGELTSIAAIPLARGTTHLALGYVRREALERSLALRCGEASVRAVPLPFQDF